jgi:PKD repeat protein
MYNEKTYKLEITNVEQAYISVVEKGTAGDGILFSAENTNLPGWKIARYYWNFGDETVATGKEVNKTFLKPGTYNVQLIVTAEPEPGGVIREACVCRNIEILPGP